MAPNLRLTAKAIDAEFKRRGHDARLAKYERLLGGVNVGLPEFRRRKS
jgi:hypothetical protein